MFGSEWDDEAESFDIFSCQKAFSAFFFRRSLFFFPRLVSSLIDDEEGSESYGSSSPEEDEYRDLDLLPLDDLQCLLCFREPLRPL